jgi:Ca2+-binding EF-hand superfamily protein
MDPAVYAERRMCRAIFGLLDADHDGRITRADVEALLDGEPAQRAEQASAILASANASADAATGELFVDWAKFEALMR